MPAVPTLFLAPTAPEARRAAWTHLASQGALSSLDPPLVFTGANGAAAWRALAREGAARAQTAPRLIRADGFFARFHGANARQRSLRGADRLWVVGDAARRVAPQLVHLERLTHSRDFLNGLADWIAALRRANRAEFPAAPLSDELNFLLRAYQARLEKLGAFDFEAAPSLFPISAAQNRAFAWPQHLLVDDLLDTSPALQIGLESLFERARTVAATLVCPGGVEAENPALQNALQFWRDCGARIVRVGRQNEATRAAARVLGLETTAPRPRNVHLSAAHTPWEEMNLIAAHIRREVENGARLDDFALALADGGGYEADARHAFAAHGVPLDWPLERSLRRSPLVRGLLRAARSCRSHWNVHELHDLFGDGTLRLELEATTFDARRLRAAGRAARHSELDNLAATRAAFEAKIAQFTRHPKNDDAPRRAAIEAALHGGDLELVAEFQTLCTAFSAPIGARAWQTHLFALVERLAGHWLESEGEAAQAAQNAIERFKSAAERVVERAQNWSDDHETERPAAAWLEWLEAEIDALSPSETTRADEWGGGVRVGSASAPPPARALFFCGWNEGAWPLALSSGPLGARGRDIGAILRAHETPPIARAAHVLARVIGENEAVFLSYAAHVEGHETSPSPLLDDLRAAWPDETWPALAEAGASTRRAHLTRWNRFLTAQNDDAAPIQLQTLLKIRAARRDVEHLGVYDGVLGAGGQVLMENWFDSRGGAPLSPSALEVYARCPLRYFFERVLGVSAEEEGDDDLDARAAGTLVHQIARTFLESWKTPFCGEDLEAAREMLGEIARRECEKLPLRPILREAEWHRLMGADGQSGPLVRWLKMELAGGHGAWAREMRPLSHTALRIEGLSNGLEQRFEMEIGGESVKGFIDRLDVSADGSQISVLDYKTGDISSLPSWKSGDGGLHFQLAIYALAARQWTRQMEKAPQLAMAYVSLRRAKIARGIGQDGTLGKGCVGAKSLSDAAFEAWLDDVSARVARIADLRRVGVFNLSLQSAKDAKCDGCGCKTLCGQHQPTQMARFEAHQSSPFVYLPANREWE